MYFNYKGGLLMLKYFKFLLKCLKNKFSFLSLSTQEKALYLSQNNLSFLAGIYYLDLKDYEKATRCFKKAKAYKHLIICYQKLGYYNKAITLSEEKKYYERGAAICMHINNRLKAAYFYSFFNPAIAAKIYRQENHFYEAGYAYLSNYKGVKAIECFKKCNTQQKNQGLKQVFEFTSVLYLTKQYSEAFILFIHLDNFYCALECAKKMNCPKLIDSTSILVAKVEAELKHYDFAAKCVENIDCELAVYYYCLSHNYKKAISILLNNGSYEKAINMCLVENDLNFAYEIASTYNPDLLSS